MSRNSPNACQNLGRHSGMFDTMNNAAESGRESDVRGHHRHYTRRILGIATVYSCYMEENSNADDEDPSYQFDIISKQGAWKWLWTHIFGKRRKNIFELLLLTMTTRAGMKWSIYVRLYHRRTMVARESRVESL